MQIIKEAIEHFENEALEYEKEAETHLARADECRRSAQFLKDLQTREGGTCK